MLLGAGCGSGASGPRFVERSTEFELELAPAGLAQAVAVDSARWDWTTFGITPDDELDIDGLYHIWFRSTAERELVLRYDLRFLDNEGFFVDNFIPFGQPVQLPPGAAQLETGEFTIRSGEIRSIDALATMRIVARVDTMGAP